MISKSEILAVIVTFHPDRLFVERFEALAKQVDRIFVVDNGSEASAVTMLSEFATRPNVTMIFNSKNLGVATALNIGISHAIAHGYSWALLFDQDTIPGEKMVEGLREVYDAHPRQETLAVIGSNYIEAQNGNPRFGKSARNHIPWIDRRVVITSGSLVSLRAYKILGPFRDEYFIDGVDSEYCLRARARGFRVIASCAPLMIHSIGQPKTHRLPWREIDISNHDGTRRYYMYRNHLVLAKEYIFKEPLWTISVICNLVKMLIALCLFEENRVAKMKSATMGLRDGLFSNFQRDIGRTTIVSPELHNDKIEKLSF